MQVGFAYDLPVGLDAQLHIGLHLVLSTPHRLPVDVPREGGMLAPQVRRHRSDTDQLDAPGDRLPSGFKITDRPGHPKVVGVRYL